VGDTSETTYARTGDGAHIAYRAIGQGPPDILFIPEWFFGVEDVLTDPLLGPFYRRLGSFSRLIIYSKRGVGSSDAMAPSDVPPLAGWLEELAAVLDNVNSPTPALFAHGVGGPLAMLFAATYPDRVSALILSNTFARLARDDDYPIGIPEVTLERFLEAFDERGWGRGQRMNVLTPGSAQDDRLRSWYARGERMAAGPGMATAIQRMLFSVDVRPALASLRVPTLILHRRDNALTGVRFGRYLHDQIPGSRLVELPGQDHPFFLGNTEELLGEVETFLTGRSGQRRAIRALSTVLFSDIVGSTNHAQHVGDRRWRETLETYYSIAQRHVDANGGRVIQTVGDGILATFAAPTDAIRSAAVIRDSVEQLGLSLRTGIHTGECELIGNDLAGIAVHIASRIQGLAQPGAILVSRTVADLVAGSGITLTDLGDHSLKGVEGLWRVYAASA
jgi:class 3 adenylate cyclase